MNLKSKILLLAILPVLLVATLVAFLSAHSSRELSEQEIQLFEANLLASKRNELLNYLDLAQTSIQHVLQDRSLTEEAAQTEVKRIINGLTYGEDGYFFVYDPQGTVLVHPIIQSLVGDNLYDFRDSNGDYLIRNLLEVSGSGGGFHRYLWSKPSDNIIKEKLSYAIRLDRWQWMLGTGLYIDDIDTEVAKIRDQVTQNIYSTFFRTFLVAAAAVIAITSIGLFINLHETRLADKRLQLLANKFVRFQVDERRRFARDLHDGINQLLVAVKFKLEMATHKIQRQEPVLETDLSDCTDVLNSTIRDVRRISHDLRPSMLDDFGLEHAVKSLLDQFEERTQISSLAEIDLPADRLPDDVETSLYRLLQEALTNVERHARASRIQLRMGMESDKIRFSFSDNGIGFLPSENSSAGIGLKNMQERVELLGGEFHIESTPGKGTSIKIVLFREG